MIKERKQKRKKDKKVSTDMHVYMFSNLFKLLEMPFNGKHRCAQTKCQ